MESNNGEVLLSNGLKMPLNWIGHIDTASYYQNEDIIGEVLQEIFAEGQISRKDLHITTKIWPNQFGDLEQALKTSIKKLQLEYVDLYLIHWPSSFFDDDHKVPLHVLWTQLESLIDQGFVKSLGLSNFNVQLTADLLTYAKHKPVANQIELHPYNTQTELVRFLLENQIIPVAYCPLARPVDPSDQTYASKSTMPDLKSNPKIQEIAKKYQKSEFQVLLKWALQRGCGIIPKATSLEHQRSNIELSDFELDKEVVEYIDSLNSNYRICNKFPFLKGYDIFA
eukprot:403363606